MANPIHFRKALTGERNLREFDLSEADLRGVDLQWSDLRKANLSKANLSRANLQGADLLNSNLTGANLFLANLQGAYLPNANFSKANLQGAKFQESDLTMAILFGASIQKAAFDNADISEADFRNVIGITVAQVRIAKGWTSAYYDQNLANVLRIKHKVPSHQVIDARQTLLEEISKKHNVSEQQAQNKIDDVARTRKSTLESLKQSSTVLALVNAHLDDFYIPSDSSQQKIQLQKTYQLLKSLSVETTNLSNTIHALQNMDKS